MAKRKPIAHPVDKPFERGRRTTGGQRLTYRTFLLVKCSGGWYIVQSRLPTFYDGEKQCFKVWFGAARARLEIDKHVSEQAAALGISERAFVERLRYAKSKKA